MFHFNSVQLCGTLTRDPEVSYTPKGTALAKFALAVNKTWKDEQGQKHEKVTFVECECWGKSGSSFGDWNKKGHTVFIEGSLELDQWEDKQSGQKRSKLKVKVDRWHFVTKPRDEQGEERPRQQSREAQPRREAPPKDPDLDPFTEPDEIPF